MESNLQKLQELCLDNQHFEIIKKIIDGLHNRQEYAIYHYHEYKKITESIETLSEVFRLALLLDENSYSKQVALKANIMACLHNMHITHDLLGQLIDKVLNLNIKGKIYLQTVINHLTINTNLQYANLVTLLHKFAGPTIEKAHPFFQYLADIVNHSKHQYTIEPIFKTNLQGQATRSCCFNSFKKGKNSYEEMDSDFFINTEYNREAKLIIQIENELINILQKEQKR